MKKDAGWIRAGLVSSWPRDVERGSGTARFLIEWTDALARAGTDVVPIGVDLDPGDPEFVHRRFAWNAVLEADPRLRAIDLLVAIDYDGFALPVGVVPRIVCPQGIFAAIAETEPEPSRSALLLQAEAERRNVRAADAVIVPSAYAARSVARHYGADPEKVHVIPHGFDYVSWRASLAAAPARTDRRATILTVAKLYPRKGIDTLLRAVARMLPARRDLQVHIVGGGVDAPRLRALTEDLGLGASVAFVGDLADRDALARRFRGADLFCLPSLHETFGFVFLEAMAAGLPVVAADVGAAPEVLGDVGLLTPPGDAVELAAAILRLLADGEERERRGMLGIARASTFAWPVAAERYLSVMKEVAG